MLNSDALKQLSQLKTDIRSTKEFAEGRVRGSSGKFGFVVLDDGREAFLPPSEMDRVFPGDRVRVSLTEEDKGKISAELDQLIESDLKYLVGQYVQRGQGHFIQPSEHGLSRWIFLPPKARGKAQPGEFIACTVTRHPFKDGKSQAKVETVIGKPDSAGIEHAFVVAQYRLPNQFGKAALEQAESIPAQLEALCAERKDLSDLGFVTIDAESTRDMDDALAVTESDNGWTLHIAVADPSSLIDAGSPLDKEARARANSVYLAGETLPMLPANLCENSFSLIAGELRPVLVMHIEVGKDGALNGFDYEFAAIRSRHKLSYAQVAQFIDGDDNAAPTDQHENLRRLDALSKARAEYRAGHSLVMEDRPDYELILNDQRKIERIEKQQRTAAQRVVEEAMLAANISAGKKLAELGGGCFSIHLGFRDERMAEIRTLLKEVLPEYAEQDLHQLDVYLKLVKELESHSDTEMHNVLAVLKRMLRPGELSNNAAPHLGLGLAHYATVTSPIRKFNDLHNHRVLRAAQQGEAQPTLDEEQGEALQQNVSTGRQADRALQQWLFCQFLEGKTGETFPGAITLVNGAGIGVRLDDFGINGFVRFNNKKNPFDFDGKRLRITRGEETFQLEQQVQVKVAAVDTDKRRIAFELAPSSTTSSTTSTE
ncbi:VacB/RNase II family 3'-5' exoribonuclease [Microbulbifer hydrolyticus]|uniref:exoribonuclease II n=1 Tax=Microbulbifer hydrolyticus TaxID=48074 RepID=A0A6P1TD16_9GAMM|nr:VacB/RNase II family 3'-5' exoribonuclease [Microbulbifer hydrolyticus]MBB5210025.1 exoribonuclease-2/ribonuclease R [Microbulbifer hydrolyticus]QHQ39450.1 VacB/RNase II family 3'-5' exoribonuclease [Microbulbifer hydrolyticus]